MSVTIKDEEGVSLALPLRDRHRRSTLSSGRSMLTSAGLKRCRCDDEDDLSTTDSEASSDLEVTSESYEDTDSDEDTTMPRLEPSVDVKQVIHPLVDCALPNFSQWKDSARYIRPPEHRIPPRKRSRISPRKQPSVFIETEDPDDPSTILILRVDGYFHLACPFFRWNPSHYASCALCGNLRSMSTLAQHLRRYHPEPAYCPICGRVFDSDDARDRHIRARRCADPKDGRAVHVPRGVSRRLLRMIFKEDDHTRREDDRWRRVYESLFPSEKRPRRAAAYLSEGLPLAVSMARDYWGAKGSGLVEEYLAKQGLADGGQFTGEDFSRLCKQAGQELVERVIADAQSDRACHSHTG